METMVYLVIGIAIAFLITATMIFSVCHCISRNSRNNPEASKLANESQSEFDRRSTRSNLRNSYLQQSPMTDETISLANLDDFEHLSARYIKNSNLSFPIVLSRLICNFDFATLGFYV